MISEKQLSLSFDSFWQRHFPLLNPTFVRWFNAGRKERLNLPDGTTLRPIPMGKEVDRFDVVAEVAFELSYETYQQRNGKPLDTRKAFERALSRIAVIKGQGELDALSAVEILEAKALLGAYEAFFDSIYVRGEVLFRPRIKGTGILDQTEADFCTLSTLYEVKAVNRNLLSIDLRQVLCYLVAGLGSREYAWTHYCIFNPRLGVAYSGRVEELLSYLSGRTLPECIADVLDALMEREQPLESKF